MVSPEPPDDTRQVLGEHALLLGSAGQGKQLPGVILGTVGGGGVSQSQEHTPTLPGRGREASRMGPGLGYSQVPQGKVCRDL